MRAALLPTVSQCPSGWKGVVLQGSKYTLPPGRNMEPEIPCPLMNTHTCENITFPQLRRRTVTSKYRFSSTVLRFEHSIEWELGKMYGRYEYVLMSVACWCQAIRPVLTVNTWTVLSLKRRNKKLQKKPPHDWEHEVAKNLHLNENCWFPRWVCCVYLCVHLE